MPAPLPPPFPTLWVTPYAPDPPPAETVQVRVRPAGGLPEVPQEVLWKALSHGLRWRLILRMATGEELTARTAAKSSRLRLNSVRKQLALLRGYGVIASREGLDRREEIYYLPAANRPEPGVLDFGSCRITLAEIPLKAPR